MGEFVFHIARGELKREDETINLTERERELLRYFAQRPGMPVSRHELAKATTAAASARSTCRSTGSGARSRTTLPTRSICRPCAAKATFSIPIDGRDPRRQTDRARRASGRSARLLAAFGDRMPKGLYARALIIIIAPMVLLQSVVAFVFLERHWQTVTRRLSTVTVQNIAMLIDLYQAYPQETNVETLIAAGRRRISACAISFAPGEDLPPARSKPFFDLLDRTLSDEMTRQIGKPFWIDTVGHSNLVDIRIKLDNAVMHVIGPPQPDLRLELADLPAVDGRHLAGAADRGDPVPAQPDQADPAAGGGGRQFRQGSAAAGGLSSRAARARCGRRRMPSSRCATASSAMSSSAPPCWPASATICARC